MTASDGRGRVGSRTPGLDDALHGGFISGQTAIVNGGSGTGKTILALQFPAAAEGDALYIGFEEREQELRRNAESLGIDPSHVSVLDLSAEGDRFFEGEAYSVLPPEGIEDEDLLERIATSIDRAGPERLVIDRSLLPDYQFRRNIPSLGNELKRRDVTAICTTQHVDDTADADLQFLGNTILDLQRTARHRSIEVTKFRGSSSTGQHALRIESETGARVYHKLVPGDYHRERRRDELPADVEGLDILLHGGLERESVTLLAGPSGVGKTTTGTLFLEASAERGEPALAFLFEELQPDFFHRSGKLGIEARRLNGEGTLEVAEIEPITQSTDEFAHHVREAVEGRGIKFVMIDGIAGYRLGLRGDDSPQELTRELHALCRYLKRVGVTVILTEGTRDLGESFVATSDNASYLVDNVVRLRYDERNGEVGKTISVVKKRLGGFDHAVHDLTIGEEGTTVGGVVTHRESPTAPDRSEEGIPPAVNLASG